MKYIELISELILPLVILLFLMAGVKNKVNAYDEFIKGVKESVDTIFDIFPPVAGLMVAIGMMRASGLLNFITDIISPVTIFLGIPKEVVPIALLRPLSGSGGIAMLTDIIKNVGPDSLAGIMASVICGSTETTFYTVAVYFGSVGITNVRHTIKCALIADFVSIITAVTVVKFIFPLL